MDVGQLKDCYRLLRRIGGVGHFDDRHDHLQRLKEPVSGYVIGGPLGEESMNLKDLAGAIIHDLKNQLHSVLLEGEKGHEDMPEEYLCSTPYLPAVAGFIRMRCSW